eukprot:2464285-Amphidinium_carterae.1
MGLVELSRRVKNMFPGRHWANKKIKLDQCFERFGEYLVGDLRSWGSQQYWRVKLCTKRGSYHVYKILDMYSKATTQ